MNTVAVAGVGMSKFGRFPDSDYRDLGFTAVRQALKDSGFEWRDIGAIFCANAHAGLGVGHNVAAQFGKTGVPIVNVENACSGGASALRLCYQSVAAGWYEVCLAIGVEMTPRGLLNDTSWPEYERAMGFNVQPANYALEIQRHMKEYGSTVKQFALVTVKNRKNGVLNPYAGFQSEITVEEVLSSRMIATPLRLLMCCATGDGAAAVILCNPARLKDKARGVYMAASVLTSQTYGNKKGAGSVNINNPDRTEIAAQQAYEMAGCGPEDLDLAEVYDTMSSAELTSAEKLGLCAKGEYGPLLEKGTFDLDGKLPVNTSGGLMARRHPLSATGLAQVAEIVWQIRGEAHGRQVPGARLGLAHCMGAPGNCAVTILKK